MLPTLAKKVPPKPLIGRRGKASDCERRMKVGGPTVVVGLMKLLTVSPEAGQTMSAFVQSKVSLARDALRGRISLEELVAFSVLLFFEDIKSLTHPIVHQGRTDDGDQEQWIPSPAKEIAHEQQKKLLLGSFLIYPYTIYKLQS